ARPAPATPEFRGAGRDRAPWPLRRNSRTRHVSDSRLTYHIHYYSIELLNKAAVLSRHCRRTAAYEKTEPNMILRQFLHTDPVGISYLFGCGGKSAGAVVDPVGDIGVYLRTAQETGMRILYVIDTHIHADHLSAGPKLAQVADAPY